MHEILIVDDADRMRELAREIVEREAFHVSGEARDGEEALALFARQRPDIVLLDLLMPGRTGLEVLGEIRRLDPEVCVVVSAGLGQEELASAAIAAGADDFVLKPFQPRRLLASLWRSAPKSLVPARDRTPRSCAAPRAG